MWERCLIVTLVTVFTVGCPTQIIYKKETERNAPPRPGIHYDKFLYGKSYGPVDIMFVVDNTESFELGLGQFRKSYLHLLDLLISSEGRLVDFHIQAASSPMAKIPSAYMANGVERTALAELFDGMDPTALMVPIFTQRIGASREQGFPKPVEVLVKGLNDPAFKARDGAQLFTVFMLGHDLNPDTPDDALAAEYQGLEQILAQSHGLHRSFLFALSRTNLAPGTESFGHCKEFGPTDRFLRFAHSVRWMEKTSFDLCDAQWGRWEEKLFDNILRVKKTLALSFVPLEPETMTLRSGTHLFRYGDDYTVDRATNSIQFLVAPKLEEGDLLEAVYRKKPIDPEFSGIPTPIGTPNPIKAP